MLAILPGPDHIAAYHLSGTVTEADFERVIADFEARLERHERIAILVDLTGLDDLTVGAGIKDLRYSLSKLWELRRFPREAVVTDKQWIGTLIHLAAPLLPHVELRTFRPAERDAALEWVSAIEVGEPVR